MVVPAAPTFGAAPGTCNVNWAQSELAVRQTAGATGAAVVTVGVEVELPTIGIVTNSPLPASSSAPSVTSATTAAVLPVFVVSASPLIDDRPALVIPPVPEVMLTGSICTLTPAPAATPVTIDGA